MNKPTRLTKEEVLKRAADNWYKFHNKLYDTKYEDYIAEVLKEWEYQNGLSDRDLIKYRNTGFKNITKEVRSKFKSENEVCDKKEEEFNKKQENKEIK